MRKLNISRATVIREITFNWIKTNTPICVLKMYRSDFPKTWTKSRINMEMPLQAYKKLLIEYPDLRNKVVPVTKKGKSCV